MILNFPANKIQNSKTWNMCLLSIFLALYLIMLCWIFHTQIELLIIPISNLPMPIPYPAEALLKLFQE